MSKIEWTDKTWNPVTGCTKISPGCIHCYAERMAKRLAGRFGYPAAPHEFDVTLRPDRLQQPLGWAKPRRVFVCSMSDLFHHEVPFRFQEDVWTVMASCRQHIFQVLTKRPRLMSQAVSALVNRGSGILDNVWAGASIENQEQADKRIPALLQTPAAVRFVSLEPLLGPIDLCRPWGQGIGELMIESLDWVIVGGESGPGARPMDPQWARDILRQCADAGLPCFMKQMGSVWAVRTNPFDDRLTNVRQQGDTKGTRMKYWPEDLRIREYPE